NAVADHDELFWNATGVWPVRVDTAVVRVTAPSAAIVRVDCFQGSSGSREPCDAQLDSGEAVFAATRPLAAGEQMAIVAGLREGAGAAPAPPLGSRPRDVFGFFDRTPALLALMLGGFAVAFGGIGVLWWKLGRDRRYVSIHYLSQDSREERVPPFASDPIVVEFEPPESMRPAQMGL